MAINNEKIVEFETYCPKCEHYEKTESEDPCWDCLGITSNANSRKPIAFKKKEIKE